MIRMETIKNYLDNMFANLPKTSQMLKLKNDILSNMEEKYNELKKNEKSENEAIGIVISEFGNIDELIDELGIKNEDEGTMLPTVTLEVAESFMAGKKESGLYIGIGVVLCIIGGAMLILLSTLADEGIIGRGLPEDFKDMLGLIALLTLVVPAVALFIYTGMKMEKYEYLSHPIDLNSSAKRIVEEKNNAFASTHMQSVIVGVCLCILSPIALFVGSAFDDIGSAIGLVVLLSIVAVAVFIFIYFGCIKESYSILLKIGDCTKEKTEDNKVIGAVAAIVWPLAVCIFLATGFIYGIWYINWIIFPITGVLFGMFSAVYNIIKGHSN
ncbi:MAG: hypothetical protein K0R09_2717 [Clostridiales bacterium]|jgi:hypothetical protein|nr:hypothetical protein [Clostridiales bacterium]